MIQHINFSSIYYSLRRISLLLQHLGHDPHKLCLCILDAKQMASHNFDVGLCFYHLQMRHNCIRICSHRNWFGKAQTSNNEVTYLGIDIKCGLHCCDSVDWLSHLGNLDMARVPSISLQHNSELEFSLGSWSLVHLLCEGAPTQHHNRISFSYLCYFL